MTRHAAGTHRKWLFGRDAYLAPLPIPTGQKPADVMNSIWRKNDIFMDVGIYNIGAFAMILWPQMILFLMLAYFLQDTAILWLGLFMTGPGVIILIFLLCCRVPPPVRFNRQRREVCIPDKDGGYWIVPWETVTASTAEKITAGQGGKSTAGMLFVGFDNPDPHAAPDKRNLCMSFSCGGGETAMAQWECIRSYMEIGPQAVDDNASRLDRPKGVLATFFDNTVETARRKGWLLTLLWEVFFGVVIFNVLLVAIIERWKLRPPPDLPYPEIIEWSKPLPPEQWAKRSAELEEAIMKQDAELAASQRSNHLINKAAVK